MLRLKHSDLGVRFCMTSYHAASPAEVVGRPVKPFIGSSEPSDLMLNVLMVPSPLLRLNNVRPSGLKAISAGCTPVAAGKPEFFSSSKLPFAPTRKPEMVALPA